MTTQSLAAMSTAELTIEVDRLRSLVTGIEKREVDRQSKLSPT